MTRNATIRCDLCGTERQLEHFNWVLPGEGWGSLELFDSSYEDHEDREVFDLDLCPVCVERATPALEAAIEKLRADA